MRRRKRITRALCVLAGIVAAQIVLYGSSLAGRTLLLPLDIVARHLPRPGNLAPLTSEDHAFGDLVLVDEELRVRAVREVRAGRIPLWDPDNFAGAPFVANNVSAVFSPYRVLDYLFPAPTTLAWTQLARALVAGCGAYLFFRRGLRVGFWPACVGAWCFPVCGYLVWWCGMGSASVVSWLPWSLLAVDAVVRRPRGWSGPALALVTTLVLLSGHLADGGQVLLATGLYAVWRLGRLARLSRRASLRPLLPRSAKLTIAWLLGFLLAAPQILPTVEYVGLSYRMARRELDVDERPALGLATIPQLAAPHLFGSTRADQLYLLKGYVQESAAAGYAGLLTLFLLAPLAFAERRRREAWFWLAAALLGAAALLNVPGFQTLVSLPGLRLLTFNRMMFLTAFSLLALGVLGLDTLLRRRFQWRAWMWLPAGSTLLLAAWCVWRAVRPPMVVYGSLEGPLFRLFPAPWWFVEAQLAGAALSVAAFAAWLVLRFAPWQARRIGVVAPVLLVAEMLWNGYGVVAQGPPEEYFPAIPVLTRLRELPPGRMSGIVCFPPMLNQMYGLRDIRGYDGLDPRWLVEMLLSTEPPLPESIRPRMPHAITMHHMTPLDSPIHDMLGVRYLVFRGQAEVGVETIISASGPADYSVCERTSALPRAYVPRRAVQVDSGETTLRLMLRENFDPRDVAYVDGPAAAAAQDVAGEASIVRESSGEVVVAYELQSPGLVVLSDTWFPGWRAWVNGVESPIYRTNYAIRGVSVPAGKGKIVFRYQPASFWNGVRICAGAALALGVWSIAVGYRQRRQGTTRRGPAAGTHDEAPSNSTDALS